MTLRAAIADDEPVALQRLKTLLLEAGWDVDAFEDGKRLEAYPAAIAKLLREATALDPKDRPSPLEFGRAFAAAL